MSDTNLAALSWAELGQQLRGLTIHDVSPTYSPQLPLFFAMPGVGVRSIADRAPEESAGVSANVWELPEHSGSHVDAPNHFVQGGASIDELRADVLFFKPFKKFDVSVDDPQPGQPVTRAALESAAQRGGFELEKGDIAIIEFGWDRYLPGGPDGKDAAWWGANEPGLSEDACEYLANAEVQAVACDTSACDMTFDQCQITGGPGHSQWFLPNGILIIEGLVNLASAPATGTFVALPLKLAAGTGSPLRVLLLSR